MNDAEWLQLNINADDIKSRSDYKQIWARIPPVKITNLVENEKCQHRLGDTFVFKNHYDKPNGICSALHHVLQLYVWRASLGFPSWEPDNPRVYRIHCPAKKGTVWEVERCIDNAVTRES
jgi:uncharacterized repeat protein (TIGR04076 family)